MRLEVREINKDIITFTNGKKLKAKKDTCDVVNKNKDLLGKHRCGLIIFLNDNAVKRLK